MAHQFFVKNYELIEHTADTGIRVRGNDLTALFGNAALAMFDIIAEKNPQAASQRAVVCLPIGKAASQRPRVEKIVVKQKAQNVEELFVNWLNELLSLSATKEKIFCDFKFKKLDEQNLEAEAAGCDIEDYKVNAEIKAATYHQLKIEKAESGWQAEVIFDV